MRGWGLARVRGGLTASMVDGGMRKRPMREGRHLRPLVGPDSSGRFDPLDRKSVEMNPNPQESRPTEPKPYPAAPVNASLIRSTGTTSRSP